MLFRVHFSHSLPHRSKTAFVLSATAGETLTWPTNTVHTVVTISDKLQLGFCMYENLNQGSEQRATRNVRQRTM